MSQILMMKSDGGDSEIGEEGRNTTKQTLHVISHVMKLSTLFLSLDCGIPSAPCGNISFVCTQPCTPQSSPRSSHGKARCFPRTKTGLPNFPFQKAVSSFQEFRGSNKGD